MQDVLEHLLLPATPRLVAVLCVGPFKWMTAREHDVQQYAERPHVDLLIIRSLLVHLFRRPVGPRAHLATRDHLHKQCASSVVLIGGHQWSSVAISGHLLVLLEQHRGTKVDELDGRVGVLGHEHDVLGLDVAVHDAA